MIQVNNRELKAVRIEVAISICIKFPRLYLMILKNKWSYRTDEEQIAENILFELIELEPCIKSILDFYYKREQ